MIYEPVQLHKAFFFCIHSMDKINLPFEYNFCLLLQDLKNFEDPTNKLIIGEWPVFQLELPSPSTTYGVSNIWHIKQYPMKNRQCPISVLALLYINYYTRSDWKSYHKPHVRYYRCPERETNTLSHSFPTCICNKAHPRFLGQLISDKHTHVVATL